LYKELAAKKPVIIEAEGLDVITIPSDPDELKTQLDLQKAAMKAGNKNTFTTANAIMQEMLKQKLITNKKYREILKDVFHV
jgi:hypothetical protein